MSKRKKRSRSKNDTSDSTSPSESDAAHDRPESQVAPPVRNLPMFIISLSLFVIWAIFLAYVALFG